MLHSNINLEHCIIKDEVQHMLFSFKVCLHCRNLPCHLQDRECVSSFYVYHLLKLMCLQHRRHRLLELVVI